MQQPLQRADRAVLNPVPWLAALPWLDTVPWLGRYCWETVLTFER